MWAQIAPSAAADRRMWAQIAPSAAAGRCMWAQIARSAAAERCMDPHIAPSAAAERCMWAQIAPSAAADRRMWAHIALPAPAGGRRGAARALPPAAGVEVKVAQKAPLCVVFSRSTSTSGRASACASGWAAPPGQAPAVGALRGFALLRRLSADPAKPAAPLPAAARRVTRGAAPLISLAPGAPFLYPAACAAGAARPRREGRP
jgi:hypothetical protein